MNAEASEPGFAADARSAATAGAPRYAAGLCAAVFAAVALPLILSGYDHGRPWFDQAHYHLPTILHFAHGGSLYDYQSATTPGYHLLLAAVASVLPDSEVALKLAGLAISLGLVIALAAYIARAIGSAPLTLCLLSPMLLSPYFLPQGVWLLPDNLAWLCVFAVLLQALRFEHRAAWYAQTSMLLLIGILVRQSTAWLLAPACLSALIGTPLGAAWGARPAHSPGRLRQRLLCALAMVLPAILALAGFVRLWHALTPPSFVGQHQGVNFAAWPFLLCVFGFYAAFYLPLILPAALQSAHCRRAVLIGGVVGFALAILQPTDASEAGGRISGLWNLADFGPSPWHRSVLITALSVVGGMNLALWCVALPRRLAIAALCTLGAFLVAQTANHMVYERYFAELVFILILMMSAELLRLRRGAIRPWRFALPVLLAAVNAALLVRVLGA